MYRPGPYSGPDLGAGKPLRLIGRPPRVADELTQITAARKPRDPSTPDRRPVSRALRTVSPALDPNAHSILYADLPSQGLEGRICPGTDLPAPRCNVMPGVGVFRRPLRSSCAHNADEQRGIRRPFNGSNANHVRRAGGRSWRSGRVKLTEGGVSGAGLMSDAICPRGGGHGLHQHEGRRSPAGSITLGDSKPIPASSFRVLCVMQSACGIDDSRFPNSSARGTVTSTSRRTPSQLETESRAGGGPVSQLRTRPMSATSRSVRGRGHLDLDGHGPGVQEVRTRCAFVRPAPDTRNDHCRLTLTGPQCWATR